MAEPRIASHPDDPSAPFADRLLLALGISPRHAEQAGDEQTLDAVVAIRTAAHRYPMVVEDYGTAAEERDELRHALIYVRRALDRMHDAQVALMNEHINDEALALAEAATDLRQAFGIPEGEPGRYAEVPGS
jgi:hypothetical protein